MSDVSMPAMSYDHTLKPLKVFVDWVQQRLRSAWCMQMYDARRFTDAGFRHHELYFPDGSCPPDTLTARFLEIAEREVGKSLNL